MVSLVSLWLPILLSAVLAFLASSVIHMVLKYHRADYARLPKEDEFLASVGKLGIPPGNYFFPHAPDMKAMEAPEMKEKFVRGPVGMVTVMASGVPAMGKQLLGWFIYCLVVGIVTAYLTSRTLSAGTEYFQVFRVAGTVSFLTYSGAQPVTSIWYKRKWSTTWKHVFDGFVYGLLTAGAFAGFWPD